MAYISVQRSQWSWNSHHLESSHSRDCRGINITVSPFHLGALSSRKPSEICDIIMGGTPYMRVVQNNGPYYYIPYSATFIPVWHSFFNLPARLQIFSCETQLLLTLQYLILVTDNFRHCAAQTLVGETWPPRHQGPSSYAGLGPFLQLEGNYSPPVPVF